MADIKKIIVSGATYDICDEYARKRIEGLSTVYSISCDYTHVSGNTYKDWDDGSIVAYSAMTIMNGDFKNATDESIVIPSKTPVATGTSAYLVLEAKVGTQYYVKQMTKMQLGDTIYVVEASTVAFDRWLSGFQESPLSATFRKIEEKIDLSQYALKTDAAKAGTYAPSVSAIGDTVMSGDGGAQTALGTATVTYKKSADVTGSAGAETITSSSAGGQTITSTAAGAATVSGASFSFTGTQATLTADVTGVSINDHSYTPAGTISAVTASAHSHTVNVSKATINNNVTGTQTGSAGAHTHSISGTGSIILGDLVVNKAASGIATYTPTGTVSKPDIIVTPTTVSVNNDAIKEVSSTFTGTEGDVSVNGNVTASGSISGTQAIAAHSHTATQTVTSANQQSVVTGLSKFNGGAATFTQGTDSFTANGDDQFTPNVPTTLDLTKFNGGTAATFTQGSKASLSYTEASTGSALTAATVSNGVLSWISGSFNTDASKILDWTTNGNDSFTANTVASLGTGFYTVGTAATFTQGSKATFTQGSDSFSFTAASLGTLDKADVIKSLPAITIGNGGAATVNFANATFTGSAAAATLTGKFTPVGTISNTYTAAGTTAVLSAVSAALSAAPAFTGDGARLLAAAGETSVTINGTAASAGAHTHSLTNSALTYVTGATTSDAGAINVTPTFTGTEATIAHSFADGAQGSISIDYTPEGTIGGSVDISSHTHSVTVSAHTHSVTTTAHTHSIALTDTTVTGSAEVAVTNHKHSIGHTHTSSVTINSIS